MNAPQRSVRYHGLDGVRAFAMILGVFLHASIPHTHVTFPWAVMDESRSVLLTLLVYAIHSFRMPAFFLIAGFFARLVFHRDGTKTFAWHRTQRILLPFVAGWLVLYPTVRALWVWSGVRTVPGSDMTDLMTALATVFSPPYVLRGLGLIHLWFLYYLLLIYGVFLCARWVFVHLLDPKGRGRGRIDSLFVRLVQSPWTAPALALPLTAILMMMHGWGVDFVTRSLIPRPVHILFYGSFFAFGWLLHRSPEVLTSLRNRWMIHLGAGLALLVPLTWLLYLVFQVRLDTSLWFRAFYFLLYGTLAWCFVFSLIGAFQRFADQPSQRWRYMADASYWIYLIHLPVVIAFAIPLREIPLPWFLKLPLVLLLSSPILLGTYHFLVRSTWIGLLLHGRRMSR